MAKANKIIVGDKYKTVEPFSIVMPGETGHVAYESDTTSLLGENSFRGKGDVMQNMKDHAKLQSKILDEKLRKADRLDGCVIIVYHCFMPDCAPHCLPL